MQFKMYHDNDKCFLVLDIYISLLCFIYLFFQKAENNRQKKTFGQNFAIFSCFCL